MWTTAGRFPPPFPISSNRDFDLHQYAEAEKATLQQLESNPSRHIRRLDGAARSACPRAGEFLSTTLQLIDDAVAGHPTPDSLCYIYNARHYKATLLSVHPVAEKKYTSPCAGTAVPSIGLIAISRKPTLRW